ncbi:hypothetical protein SLS57_003572 [Botryosphaeria dothidea]
MPATISDRVLWLSIGAGIYALTRAVSYGLHHVYNLTEVEPALDSPRTVAQGTEDDIPLPSLQVLATQHPNLEIRKAATSIVTTRVLNDPTTIRRILADYKRPDGAPDQRAARNAIQLIRSTNGVDLEDWEEDHNEDDIAAIEVGFDATGRGGGGRTHSTSAMRREMASRYWAVEHVRDGDWTDGSDDNSHADDTSIEDNDDEDDDDQDRTITVDGAQLASSETNASAGSQPSRRAGEFEALVEADVSALFEDLGRSAASVDGIEAAYGTANAGSSSSRARENGEITTVWDRQRPQENRRADGLRERRRGDTSHVVDSVPRPHGRRHLRARSSRESEEEVARRRVRREAVVVNDGDRPISQDDIIQRPLQRRSY